MPHVLIADEDPVTAGLLSELAQADSYEALVVDSMVSANLRCEATLPDFIFINYALLASQMVEWLDHVAKFSSCEVVLMGEAISPNDIVDAFRHGISDFLFTPIDAARVRYLLRQRVAGLAGRFERSERGDSQQVSRLFGAKKLAAPPPLLGQSSAMRTLRHQIDRVARTEASVLLLGESGAGKELVAQAIHCQSDRRRQTFLPVNCGAISPQLIESEIFGHEKGSFTGADRQHKGYFERASGGTLFLDEVVEMPVDLQVKLLRVLETGTFMRIGSSQELTTDVRIVAATNRDPEAAIAEGRLRLDLYHRLNVFPIKVPPLRERGSDIELIAQHFLCELNELYGTNKCLSAGTQASLRRYYWPGNVRELRNFIQRAYILADLSVELLVPDRSVARTDTTASMLAIPVGSSLADADRKLIFATLELCGGVKKRAADLLGISLKTLYNRLEEYSHPGNRLMLPDAGKKPNASSTSLCLPARDSGLLN